MWESSHQTCHSPSPPCSGAGVKLLLSSTVLLNHLHGHVLVLSKDVLQWMHVAKRRAAGTEPKACGATRWSRTAPELLQGRAVRGAVRAPSGGRCSKLQLLCCFTASLLRLTCSLSCACNVQSDWDLARILHKPVTSLKRGLTEHGGVLLCIHTSSTCTCCSCALLFTTALLTNYRTI